MNYIFFIFLFLSSFLNAALPSDDVEKNMHPTVTSANQLSLEAHNALMNRFRMGNGSADQVIKLIKKKGGSHRLLEEQCCDINTPIGITEKGIFRTETCLSAFILRTSDNPLSKNDLKILQTLLQRNPDFFGPCHGSAEKKETPFEILMRKSPKLFESVCKNVAPEQAVALKNKRTDFKGKKIASKKNGQKV